MDLNPGDRVVYCPKNKKRGFDQKPIVATVLRYYEQEGTVRIKCEPAGNIRIVKKHNLGPHR